MKPCILTNLPPTMQRFAAVTLVQDETATVDSGLLWVGPFATEAQWQTTLHLAASCGQRGVPVDVWLDGVSGEDDRVARLRGLAHRCFATRGCAGTGDTLVEPLLDLTTFHPFAGIETPATPLPVLLVHGEDVAGLSKRVKGFYRLVIRDEETGEPDEESVTVAQLLTAPERLQGVAWCWVSPRWQDSEALQRLALLAVAAGGGLAAAPGAVPAFLSHLPVFETPSLIPMLLPRNSRAEVAAAAIRHTQRRGVMLTMGPWVTLNRMLTARFGDEACWRFPKVSVFSPTMRADLVPVILASFDAQSYQNKEIVIILHGTPAEEARQVMAAHGRENVIIRRVPAEMSVGFAINMAIDEGSGFYSVKMDDDDYYGPHYLLDMVINATLMDADLFGKGPKYIYFESQQQTVLRTSPLLNDNRRLDAVNMILERAKLTGATLSGKRSVLRRLRFSAWNRGAVDTIFHMSQISDEVNVVRFDTFNKIIYRSSDDEAHTSLINEALALRWAVVLDEGLATSWNFV